MKVPETIIVQFVSDYVYTDLSKLETKYIVQFAGISDRPSKLMKLQVWDMPFLTREEANETLAAYQEKMKVGSFIIRLMDK